MKIVTYNIQHAITGEEAIARVLKDLSPDVVGMQEVDCRNARSGGRDQPALLAKLSGMPHYHFAPATAFRGGEYGHLILSKYPIVRAETVPLPSDAHEKRAVGHAVLDVGGTEVDFFNTHLSFEDKATRTRQFAALADLLSPCRRFVLTGDFNTGDFSEFASLGAALMTNRAGRVIGTFVESNDPIDNILLSIGFVEQAAGRAEVHASDHYPLWADVTLL